MKKYIAGIIILLSTGVFLSGCTSDNNNDIAQLQDIVSSNADSMNTPGRPAEINGMITSMEGNKIMIKNEIGREVLSDEERQQRKEDRLNMTQEEKQATRTQEMESFEVEDKLLEVPVGTIITKGTGNSSDGESAKAVFDDLKEGAYISVWINDSGIEMIKIKGL